MFFQLFGGLFVHDLEGNILDANQQAYVSLGYSREELLNLRVPELVAEDVSYQGFKNVWDVIRPNQFISLDSSVKRKDGSAIPIEIHLTRVELNKRPVILALARDLTERIRAEEEKLAREKLQAAVATAGAVCHELNQPIQTITSISELLLVKQSKSFFSGSEIQVIHNEIMRMAEITRRLENITKYETKTYVGETKILDLEESSQ